MKLLDFNVRLSVYVLNLRRLLSIVIRCASLFGVGGSGRSPVSTNPPTPRSGVWGSVEKGLVVGRRKRQGVVNKVAKASLGEGGWGPKRPGCVTGAPPGGVQSVAARSQIVVGKAPK